jgi:hypothetical protein
MGPGTKNIFLIERRSDRADGGGPAVTEYVDESGGKVRIFRVVDEIEDAGSALPEPADAVVAALIDRLMGMTFTPAEVARILRSHADRLQKE